MLEILHNFQKSFRIWFSFNMMYDVPSLPWWLTFSADQLSMIMTFIQLLINFLFLFLCCWDNRFFITQIYCKLQQISYNYLSGNQKLLMQNKRTMCKRSKQGFQFFEVCKQIVLISGSGEKQNAGFWIDTKMYKLHFRADYE